MRSNAMKSCAVGAMLFGGTLGVVSTAEAGLTFTNADVAPTLNYAYSYSSRESAFVDRGFSATSVTFGSLNVAWSATTGSGFSTTVTQSGSDDYIASTTRTFTVTDSQQVTFSWIRSGNLAFAIVTGPSTFEPVPGLGAGWDTLPSGFSRTTAAAGTVTVTLAAGNYRITSDLGFYTTTGPASFNLVVPAPGAVALLGAAGLVGMRRRKA